MAESPSHKLGQIIGNLLEDVMRSMLQDFCDGRNLYLDAEGERPGIRDGKKVTWPDMYGNFHDLDFVIESGGSAQSEGTPVAFIEVAWRRYTRHSKNKVQEIQSAILPVADKYRWNKPFLGAVLAGEFTGPSLRQLESVGFHLLYLRYGSVVSAFSSVGIDMEFDEATPDEDFKRCVEKIELLSPDSYGLLKTNLMAEGKKDFDLFFQDLARALDRKVVRLVLIPLFGKEYQFTSVSDTLKFLNDFQEQVGEGGVRKYEIIAEYSNGDSVNASFSGKNEAARFLDYLSR